MFLRNEFIITDMLLDFHSSFLIKHYKSKNLNVKLKFCYFFEVFFTGFLVVTVLFVLEDFEGFVVLTLTFLTEVLVP